MISLLLGLVSAIPGVASAVQYVLGKKYDAQVAVIQAKAGVSIEQAKQIVAATQTEDHERSARLTTIASNTLLTFLVIFFALPFGIFIWQVVVWDITICPHFPKSFGFACSTDAIRGQVADWGNTIIIAIFGAPTAITIGKMILAKKLD